MNRLAFILYDSRSGSTLLASLLNQYRGIVVSHESAFISRIIEYDGKIQTRNDIAKLVLCLFEEIQFFELGLNKESIINAIINLDYHNNKKNIICAILDEYFISLKKNTQKEVWLIKHPPYEYMDVIIEYFPNVKFVHILRDGRAVFNSKKTTKSLSGKFMQKDIVKAAFDWKTKLRIIERFEKYIYTVKYEDLLLNEDKACNSIMDYLEVIGIQREKVNSKDGFVKNIGSNQKKIHKNIIKKSDSSFIDKWKSKLTINEIKVYELINRKYLLKNGYQIYYHRNVKTYIFFTVEFLFYLGTKIYNFVVKINNPGKIKIRLIKNYYIQKHKIYFMLKGKIN